MLTASIVRQEAKRQERDAKKLKLVPLNRILSSYDEARHIACRQVKMTYMRHDSDTQGSEALYTIEERTALSKTPSLTGPGVFGLGTRHSQTRANGKPL